jgi:hypothetical protein
MDFYGKKIAHTFFFVPPELRNGMNGKSPVFLKSLQYTADSIARINKTQFFYDEE